MFRTRLTARPPGPHGQRMAQSALRVERDNISFDNRDSRIHLMRTSHQSMGGLALHKLLSGALDGPGTSQHACTVNNFCRDHLVMSLDLCNTSLTTKPRCTAQGTMQRSTANTFEEHPMAGRRPMQMAEASMTCWYLSFSLLK
jgi:hypothetical protein